VLYQKQNEEDIFTIALDKKALEAVRTKLPFSRDSDAFQILV
jgi:hypothetical protein